MCTDVYSDSLNRVWQIIVEEILKPTEALTYECLVPNVKTETASKTALKYFCLNYLCKIILD